MTQLAIDGGSPVRTQPLPTVGDITGRGFGDAEIANLTDVIKSGKLFRWGGKYVEQFERGFAEKLGVEHATASTSGTAAIHVALGALNLDCGRGVLTAPITDTG
ncbi:MAG: DegT/DnrJ/EryC1/StrS family aminotransferase, partial [Actinobacteria bacterium]|nr:DegT/DnrJ/EryC1/StrS family aminotransferase [Actinomycetota bacterium]